MIPAGYPSGFARQDLRSRTEGCFSAIWVSLSRLGNLSGTHLSRLRFWLSRGALWSNRKRAKRWIRQGHLINEPVAIGVRSSVCWLKKISGWAINSPMVSENTGSDDYSSVSWSRSVGRSKVVLWSPVLKTYLSEFTSQEIVVAVRVNLWSQIPFLIQILPAQWMTFRTFFQQRQYNILLGCSECNYWHQQCFLKSYQVCRCIFGKKILASFQNNIAAGLASYLIAIA